MVVCNAVNCRLGSGVCAGLICGLVECWVEFGVL